MSSTNAAASAARKMSTKWVWRRRHMGLTINPPIPLLFTPQYRSQATKRHHLIAQNQLGISRGIAVVLGGTLVASFATAAFRKDNEPEAGSADEFTQSAQLALSKRPLMEVLRATFVFEVVSRPFLVECGKKTFNIFDSLGLTWLYRPLVKKTFFAHFCGGETSEELQRTVKRLALDGINSILFYNVEADVKDFSPTSTEETEKEFERTSEANEVAHIRTISVASCSPGNFIAVKVTGLVNPASLLAFNSYLGSHRQSLSKSIPETIQDASDHLSAHDFKELKRLHLRLERICTFAKDHDVKVIVDAEQTYFQRGIDALVLDMCRRTNTTPHNPVVYDTYQMYLKSTSQLLHDHLAAARAEGFGIGFKLVRGAYLFSEPPDNRQLFHDSKADTDRAYNQAVETLLTDRFADIGLFLATHNTPSIREAIGLVRHGKGCETTPLFFGQLYGLNDRTTLFLAETLPKLPEELRQSETRVFKCIPYGKVDDTMAYLIRRADENTSMLTRATEERDLLRKELWRRIASPFTPST